MLNKSILAAVMVSAVSLSGCQSLCDRFLNKGANQTTPVSVATSTHSTGSVYNYQPAATSYTTPTTVGYSATPSSTSTYTGSSTYLGSSSASCPDGTYLTGDGTCMMSDTSYNLASLSTNSISSSHSYTASTSSQSYTTPLRGSYSSAYSPVSYTSQSPTTSHSAPSGVRFYDKPSVMSQLGTCPSGYMLIDDGSCLFMGELYTPNPYLTNPDLLAY